MRPLGARKTRRHCTNQHCGICRPCWPAKGGRATEKRSALAQEYDRYGRRVVSPEEVAIERERVLAIKFR